jgi:synaptobrevin family protein YKT6
MQKLIKKEEVKETLKNPFDPQKITIFQSVLERGEKLDDLIAKSENLSEQSKMFYAQSKRMNKCCNVI